MVSFDTKLDKVLQGLSEENKDILLTKLSIMFKLNEIVHYQNCKNSIMDTKGKELMEILIERLKISIGQLESSKSILPEELTGDFTEISTLILNDDKSSTAFSNGEDDKAHLDSDAPPTDSINEDYTEPDMIDEILEKDRIYLETCLQKKIYSIRFHQKLVICACNNNCRQIFKAFVEQEKDAENLLVHNYQVLENTGKWREQ